MRRGRPTKEFNGWRNCIVCLDDKPVIEFSALKGPGVYGPYRQAFCRECSKVKRREYQK